MAEDFYIKFDSATRWEDKIHYLVAESNIREKINTLMPLLYRLIQSQIDPSGDHICPICGLIIKVRAAMVASGAGSSLTENIRTLMT